MDAKELAAKFVAKAAAAVAEKDRQETAKPDDDGKRLEEDVEDCKRAMTEVVIPFMSELKAHFPQDQFSFAPQIDVSDHKFVGVSNWASRTSSSSTPSSRSRARSRK